MSDEEQREARAGMSAASEPTLRQRAEGKTGANRPAQPTLSPGDTQAMLQELQVHQIELEMQNEDLRRAQDALESERARYFELYDLAPVGYCTLGEHGLIRQANLAAATLLGVARTALIGRPFSRFIDRGDQDVFYRHHKKLSESGAPQAYALRMLSEEGAPFWAHLTAAAAQDADGAPVQRVVINDITASKDVERALIAARVAAEAASRAKSEFLANMSHEIRTPLNGVIGNVQLLEMSEVTDEQQKYLSAIVLSGDNLLSLINDILDLSKIEAGKLELEQAAFGLRACLSNVMHTLHAGVAGKGLALKVNISDAVPDALIGDQLRVKQIVLNLLGNAIKFTRAGSITLTAAISAPASMADETVLIELAVSDTGIGMSRAAMEHIFDDFVQADSSVTRQYGGTGLGLALCRRLARLMGGSIAVESAEGVGSTFRVLLPLGLADAAPQAGDIAPTPLWAGARLNILAAEDNELNRRFIGTLLEKMGHRVTVAENGKQALAALAAARARGHREAGAAASFDLVLMDIQMPVMDGMEALKLLRQREQGSGACLPVIALTAFAMRGDEQKFLAAGFDGYVSKPLELQKLVGEMQRVLGLKAAQAPA